jgi:hypothetical protein
MSAPSIWATSVETRLVSSPTRRLEKNAIGSVIRRL